MRIDVDIRRLGLRLAAAILAAWTAGAAVAGSAELPELAGPWRFRSGDEPRGADATLDDLSWPTQVLPADLEQLASAAGGRSASLWLRRQVRIPARIPCPRSQLAWMVGAPPRGRYDLFADGQEVGVFDTGDVGPRWLRKPRVFSLPPGILGPDGRVLLALRYTPSPASTVRRIARLGPLGLDLALGCQAELEERAELIWLRHLHRQRSPLVLGSIFLVLGAYHLQLFSRRRKYVDYLWFGIASILFGALTFLASPWIFDLTESYGAVRRVLAALIHLLAAAWLQFMWPFLGRRLSPGLRAYQLSNLLIAALLLVPPTIDLPYAAVVRWLWLLPALVATTTLLAQEAWRGNPEARIVGAGGLALVIAVLAEAVRQITFGTTTSPLPFWAFAVFAVTMTTSLSGRFTRVHGELDRLRLQLERMVADRTEELSLANQRLQNEIAERRLAEGAMRVLERAVEQSSDGIAVTDMEGNTRFVNEAWARTHGYEVLEVLGQHFNVFFTPQQMHNEVLAMIRKAEQEGAHEGEIDHRHRDGSTFPTWMSVTLLRDADGKPDGFVAIARDISQRRAAASERLRLESRVQRAQRLESLARLAGGIAHDYNNLLTAVLSNASLALRDATPGSPLEDRLRQIESAADRARDLTSQLLTYAGEDELRREPLQLSDLVRSMEEPLRPLIGERATLDLQLAAELPLVELDQDQIRQMIHHLVNNAVESLGTERGFITLRTSKLTIDAAYLEDAVLDGEQEPGEYVFLEVSDSGMGMDDETRQRMFEPLFTTKSSASGLGLAVVQGIVRRHGGIIKVFTEAGRGTTVQVLFPPAAERAAERVAAAPAEDVEHWRASGTILVVDDQDYVREVSQAILEPHGFQVLVAGDGPQALALYRRHREAIRLVLLDWTMPEMSGEEVFREIRRLAPKAKVIVMSGWRERQVMNDLAGLGLAGFLQKPFRPEHVITKVREILG
ncbi:MAG: PAS domain S-box protein [Acidobacteria bacterium]|nr:MAG: PAS domain S-box protein [Acidobacteriota bacterium]